ncbi:MAG: DUF2752 domain-containing protein [Muribaculaceae bacterium]|nr:DUF2752 domain-containing protein [Muribaculaceae bacterium]MDE6633517.1 DUF2752 domain-containing protein [Muribaculaceae bacterium]
MLNKRTFGAIVVAVAIIAFAIAYYFFDPVEVKWMPKCIWKVATGTDCPGCGSQRMAHALMHGDFRSAWHANAYALCMIPVIIFLLWLEFAKNRCPKLYAIVHRPAVITSLLATVILWWVFRNLVY